MLNLCNNNHDEVCFEGHHCPVCHIKDEFADERSRLQNQIGELEAQIEDLKNQEGAQ